MGYKKKLVAGFLLTTVILSVPLAQTASASDFGASVWARYFKDVIVKAASQTAFKLLSNKIIEKIQSGGPGGGPAFIQNWVNFATQAQNQGEGVFRALLSNSNLCGYFSGRIRSAFGVGQGETVNVGGHNLRTDSLQSFGLQTNCTLPSNFNLTNYQNNFSGNGGWQAWSRMLEPQNNPYGVLFASLNEVAKQRNLSQTTALSSATAGKGFTGLLAGDNGCTLRGTGNHCLIQGNIKTPGDTLAEAGIEPTRGTRAMLAAADGASIAVTALTTFALNKLFDMGGAPEENIDSPITSQERTVESYNQEFCTAQDNISQEAAFYIRDHHPTAFGPRNFDADNSVGHRTLLEVDPVSHNIWGAIIGSLSFPLEHNQCNGGNDICGKSFCVWSTEQYHSENTYPYSRCAQACMKAVGEAPSLPAPIFNPPSPSVSPTENNPVCTTTGQEEQSFMLPLLNGTPPVPPQEVATRTNQHFNLITGSEAVYYPNSNTIGLPEFYMAGPTPSRPVSPRTGLPWDVVIRCTPP